MNGRAAEVLERYGRCLQLIPVDRNFRDITIGLHEKSGVLTVWSYSSKPGVSKRLRQVRDGMVILGGLLPETSTQNQARFACGEIHVTALRILFEEAVGRQAESLSSPSPLQVQDLRSHLVLNAIPRERREGWMYQISTSGSDDTEIAQQRVRSTIGGLQRHGEMELTDPAAVAFPCGERHDELVGLLLTYARNAS